MNHTVTGVYPIISHDIFHFSAFATATHLPQNRLTFLFNSFAMSIMIINQNVVFMIVLGWELVLAAGLSYKYIYTVNTHWHHMIKV